MNLMNNECLVMSDQLCGSSPKPHEIFIYNLAWEVYIESCMVNFVFFYVSLFEIILYMSVNYFLFCLYFMNRMSNQKLFE